MEIANGKEIFELVDTHGLPLEIIALELRDKGQVFNIAQFIEAASNAGWTEKRVVNTIMSTTQERSLEFRGKLAIVCSKYYPTVR